MYSVESLYILFLGVAAAGSVLIKSFLKNTYWSPIPFYIIFGLLSRQCINYYIVGPEPLFKMVHLFGEIGLILILFQVGVESNLNELLKQLKNALLISIPEVMISGLMMFFCFYTLFNLPIEIAALLSAGFTATSIALSITPWKEAGFLKQKPGQLVVDLSALDDIAGITLMVIVFSAIGYFSGPSSLGVGLEFFLPLTLIFVKIFFLIAFAYAFSVFIEPKLTNLIKKYEIGPDPVVTIICLALIFSALSGFFGLSIALGSFLLGLSFSRDPSAVRLLSSYQSLESFFIPFFFFSIGFSVTALATVSPYAIAILFTAALLGKVIGVGIPSYLLKFSSSVSFILGLTMVPRAEVALVVIGFANGIFAIPPKIYSECIIVILITCFFPLLIQPLLSSIVKEESKPSL